MTFTPPCRLCGHPIDSTREMELARELGLPDQNRGMSGPSSPDDTYMHGFSWQCFAAAEPAERAKNRPRPEPGLPTHAYRIIDLKRELALSDDEFYQLVTDALYRRATHRQPLSACCGRQSYSVSSVHGSTGPRCAGCGFKFRAATYVCGHAESDGRHDVPACPVHGQLVTPKPEAPPSPSPTCECYTDSVYTVCGEPATHYYLRANGRRLHFCADHAKMSYSDEDAPEDRPVIHPLPGTTT